MRVGHSHYPRTAATRRRISKLEEKQNHPRRTMTLTTVTIPLSRTHTYTVVSKKGCQLAHLKRKKILSWIVWMGKE